MSLPLWGVRYTWIDGYSRHKEPFLQQFFGLQMSTRNSRNPSDLQEGGNKLFVFRDSSTAIHSKLMDCRGQGHALSCFPLSSIGEKC